MWSLTCPTPDQLRRLAASQSSLGLTYPNVGLSATGSPGFDVDDNRVLLGHGPEVFAAACRALREWRQFPSTWTRIWPDSAPIAEGETILIIARVFGLWWSNACRIVTVMDEPTRFGFAYGTLPHHIERGEERFLIEWHDGGGVWYSVRAVSRARYWMVRAARPMARRMQARFARESLAAMRRAVGTGLSLQEGNR